MDCGICYEEQLYDDNITVCCKQSLCRDCYQSIKNKKCPFCRRREFEIRSEFLYQFINIIDKYLMHLIVTSQTIILICSLFTGPFPASYVHLRNVWTLLTILGLINICCSTMLRNIVKYCYKLIRQRNDESHFDYLLRTFGSYLLFIDLCFIFSLTVLGI
jgi:hypothetical protein